MKRWRYANPESTSWLNTVFRKTCHGITPWHVLSFFNHWVVKMITEIEEVAKVINDFGDWWANQSYALEDEFIQRTLIENLGILQSWEVSPQIAREVAKTIAENPCSFRSCTLHVDMRMGLCKRYERYGDNWVWTENVVMYIHSKSSAYGRKFKNGRRKGLSNMLGPYLPEKLVPIIVNTVDRKRLKGWHAASHVVKDVLDRIQRDKTGDFTGHIFEVTYGRAQFRETLPFTAENCLKEFMKVYFDNTIGSGKVKELLATSM